MLILIEHLPESTTEDEVMTLVSEFDGSAGVKLIGNGAMSGAATCSCVITLADTSQVLVNTIAARLDGLYWHGVQLSAHRLLFG